MTQYTLNNNRRECRADEEIRTREMVQALFLGGIIKGQRLHGFAVFHLPLLPLSFLRFSYLYKNRKGSIAQAFSRM